MKIDSYRNSFTLRVEPRLWSKFKYIAGYNGRTVNKQLIVMIRDCVDEFEKKNGLIDVTKKE